MSEANPAKVKVIEDEFLNNQVSFKGEKDESITGEVISVTPDGELRIKEVTKGFIYVGLPEDVDLVVVEAAVSTERSIPKKETSPAIPTPDVEEEGPLSALPVVSADGVADGNFEEIAETLPPAETSSLAETVLPESASPVETPPPVAAAVPAETPASAEAPSATAPVQPSPAETPPLVGGTAETPSAATAPLGKRVKDQVLADILIREEGGTIDSITADLQAEAGGSPTENKARVINFMRFLGFLGVAELDDDLYVINLVK